LIAVSELGGRVADTKLAYHCAPGLPRFELPGVLPQRLGGDSIAVAVSLGAVAFRFAAAAPGRTGGLPRFKCEASPLPALGVERVEIGAAVAVDLLPALTVPPALASAAAASSVARSGFWLFDGRNSEGGERETRERAHAGGRRGRRRSGYGSYRQRQG
jgi:hypothetical protein